MNPNKRHNSVVIAIAQAKREPWEKIYQEGQLPTWISRFQNEVRIVNFCGLSMSRFWQIYDDFHERVRASRFWGRFQYRLDLLFVPWLIRNIPKSKELVTNSISDIQIMTNASVFFSGRRWVGLINWFLEENNHDFLFIINSSSLINFRRLEEIISDLPTDQYVYAGFVHKIPSGSFISGSGVLLNRMSAKVVISKFRKFPHRLLNDVALGTLLNKNGVPTRNLPWMPVKTINEVFQLSKEDLLSTFQFRCKTFSEPRRDSEVMRALHNRLISISDQSKNVY